MFRKSLLVLALFAVSAFSYSYTIFAPMTGAGSFALNPVIYVDDRNSGGTEVFMYYGLTDKLDFCSSISTTNGVGGFSTMLRYDFGGAKILGLRVNPSWISPHFNRPVACYADFKTMLAGSFPEEAGRLKEFFVAVPTVTASSVLERL